MLYKTYSCTLHPKYQKDSDLNLRQASSYDLTYMFEEQHYSLTLIINKYRGRESSYQFVDALELNDSDGNGAIYKGFFMNGIPNGPFVMTHTGGGKRKKPAN